MPLWVFESLCVSVREREILWGRGVYSTGDEGRGEGGKEWTVNESQSVVTLLILMCHVSLSVFLFPVTIMWILLKLKTKTNSTHQIHFNITSCWRNPSIPLLKVWTKTRKRAQNPSLNCQCIAIGSTFW